jgi:hypothetical protein
MQLILAKVVLSLAREPHFNVGRDPAALLIHQNDLILRLLLVICSSQGSRIKHLNLLDIIIHSEVTFLPGNSWLSVVASFRVNCLFWKHEGNKFTGESKHHLNWLKYAPIVHRMNALHLKVSGYGKSPPRMSARPNTLRWPGSQRVIVGS